MDYTKEIIIKLSEKYRIPEVSVKLIIDHVLSEVKNKLSSDDLPEVLLHNFGRFQVSIKALESKIIGVFTYADNNNGRIEYYQRLNRYIKAYKRICKENNKEYSQRFIDIENKVNSKLDEKK